MKPAEPTPDHNPHTHPGSTAGPGGRLPLVRVSEAANGMVTVLLDGRMVVAGPIDRRRLGGALSVLADEHGPIRVELTDATGRTFVDVLHPPTHGPDPTPPAAPVAAPVPNPLTSTVPGAGGRLVEVAGQGFVPGEDVEVAAIVLTSSAGPDGTARGLVDLDQLPDGTRGIVLLGAVSGTLTVEYLR